MPTPRYNKYNPGKTKGFHPINKWRCDSSNHPVITSSAKCASITPKTKFSQQELAILTGLSNTLKCNEQDAVRIALYEASRSARKAHETAFNMAGNQQRKATRAILGGALEITKRVNCNDNCSTITKHQRFRICTTVDHLVALWNQTKRDHKY